MGSTSYCNPYDYERAHGYAPGDGPDTEAPANPDDDGVRDVMGVDSTGTPLIEQKVVSPPPAAPATAAHAKVETK